MHVFVCVDVTDTLTSYQMANSHIIFDTKDGIPTIIVTVIMSFFLGWATKRKEIHSLKAD